GLNPNSLISTTREPCTVRGAKTKRTCPGPVGPRQVLRGGSYRLASRVRLANEAGGDHLAGLRHPGNRVSNHGRRNRSSLRGRGGSVSSRGTVAAAGRATTTRVAAAVAAAVIGATAAGFAAALLVAEQAAQEAATLAAAAVRGTAARGFAA